MRKRIIHILGTASGVGKSTITTALCRHFSNLGVSVAPFKAVNMSRNSIATKQGGEIARAQWLQAVAARTTPRDEMNPILLKPETDDSSMLIVNGVTVDSMSVSKYSKYLKKNGQKIVSNALRTLLEEYELIIAEGMGAAAEINMEQDLANRFPKEFAKEKAAFIVGDIDRGGVFAALYGSKKLYPDEESISGLIVNKVRSNTKLIKSGIDKLSRLTESKVVASVPYIEDISLPKEDILDYALIHSNNKIAVIRYPGMENYSDIDSLIYSANGVNYIYGSNANELNDASLIILPGSKKVIKDLEYIRRFGIDLMLYNAAARGAFVIGICGGYQMLGKIINDPKCVESRKKFFKGLGLLDSDTCYSDKKVVRLTEYKFTNKFFYGTIASKGYEIRYGNTKSNSGPCANLLKDNSSEGSLSENGKVIGTNIHGIMENSDLLRYISLNTGIKFDKSEMLENKIEDITKRVMASFDLRTFYELIGM